MPKYGPYTLGWKQFGQYGFRQAFGRRALGQGGGYRAAAQNVAPFGDSISNQNFGTGIYEAHGYLIAANELMGWPMNIIANGGVSGNTTTQMLARLEAFLDGNPTIGMLLILGGTNDPGNGINAATTIANLEAMYAICRQKRVRAVALTITPRTDQAGAILTFIQTVNAAILASNGPLAKADTFTALADAGNSLLPYANSLYDSVHPAIAGAMRMARDALVAVLAPIVGTNGPGTSGDLDYREYAANPMALGDNADNINGWRLQTGVTGTGPNGWTVSKRNTGAGVASKAGAAARMVMTSTANWDGVGYWYGGEQTLALGRYDQGWAGSTAYTHGRRVRPTTPNGFHYRLITPGTTGASEPLWPTTEGTLVVDGGVTWLCQRTPQAGDKFIARVDVQFSGLVTGKWIAPRVSLSAINTAGSGFGGVVGNFVDLSSMTDFGLDYAPPFMRIETPEMTMGSDTLRYLQAVFAVHGQAAGGVTMDVLRASIRRTSP